LAPGKLLMITGLILLVAGLVFTFGPKIPFVGKLPGDFHFKRDNYSLHFPLTSCLLASLAISILIWFFKK